MNEEFENNLNADDYSQSGQEQQNYQQEYVQSEIVQGQQYYQQDYVQSEVVQEQQNSQQNYVQSEVVQEQQNYQQDYVQSEPVQEQQDYTQPENNNNYSESAVLEKAPENPDRNSYQQYGVNNNPNPNPVPPQYNGFSNSQPYPPYNNNMNMNGGYPYNQQNRGYTPPNNNQPYNQYPNNPYQNNYQMNGYPYNNQNGYGYNNPPQPPKKKHTGLKVALWCIGSVAVVVAAAAAIFIAQSNGGGIFDDRDESSRESHYESSYGTYSDLPDAPHVSADENGPQISAGNTPKSDSESTKTANAAYLKAYPSVVCITSYEAGTDYALTSSGEGSGIIITSDGYIATNSHVVEDSSSTGVMITLSDGRQYLGTIIGVDVKTDLAVVKISASGLTAAEIGDSDNLDVGQDVFAIGNPGGSAFSNSMTKGTVSALNRVLSSNGYVKYIQTDAAINPGNSGGALINEFGQVIGMNTAKLVGTDYEGMGFAIPSDTMVDIVNKLIKYGYVNDRGTLAIEGRTCTLYMSKANNVPQGMMITSIKSNSPLSSTKVQADDIITAINGTTVTSAIEFIDELKKYTPGEKITLTVYSETKKSGKTSSETFDVQVELIPDSVA